MKRKKKIWIKDRNKEKESRQLEINSYVSLNLKKNQGFSNAE